MNIKHIKQNPSLPGLYVLTSKTEMARKGEDVTPFLNAYQETFASLYPEHPYGQQMQMLIKNGQPEIGKPYVDFSAPDLNGNKVQISKYIQVLPDIRPVLMTVTVALGVTLTIY